MDGLWRCWLDEIWVVRVSTNLLGPLSHRKATYSSIHKKSSCSTNNNKHHQPTQSIYMYGWMSVIDAAFCFCEEEELLWQNFCQTASLFSITQLGLVETIDFCCCNKSDANCSENTDIVAKQEPFLQTTITLNRELSIPLRLWWWWRRRAANWARKNKINWPSLQLTRKLKNLGQYQRFSPKIANKFPVSIARLFLSIWTQLPGEESSLSGGVVHVKPCVNSRKWRCAWSVFRPKQKQLTIRA